MNIFQKIKDKAFTLIELLVVIAVIVILVGFVIAGVKGSQVKAKEVKTKNILKRVAEAITSFEADWGQIPVTPSQLISPAAIKAFAEDKNVTLGEYVPYLDKIPQTPGFSREVAGYYYCKLYDSDTAPNHAHAIPLFIYQPFTGNKICSNFLEYGGDPACNSTLESRNNVLVPAYAWTRVYPIIADSFGSPVYYIRDIEEGTYMLISPGPDGEISLDFVNWGLYLYGEKSSYSYDENSTDSRDQDNIIYSYKIS